VPDGVQRALALIIAVASAPLLAALAIAVRIDSPGGSIYVARRVGEHGQVFGVFKLRTMRADAAVRGPGVSVAGDARVTRMGRLLRGTRLDELPQLWNVVRGEMRLVGPRPEDARFVDRSDPLHREVFEARPGITGPTQLLHVDEAGQLDDADPERSYRERLLPVKVAMDAAYLRRRSTGLDAWILLQTVLTIAGRPPAKREVERRLGLRELPEAD
jgi:lipopolysaccharide/colanic/teichoic acid biosynthesis glycosyltransferase